MKKTLVICFALVMCLTMATAASAEDGGLYLTGKAGLGFMRGDKSLSSNNTDSTGDNTKWSSSALSYGAAVGWNWLDAGVPLRTEVEYYDHGKLKMTHTDSNATFDVSAKIQTVQFNLFWDFHNETSFIPYLGGGVGIANVKGAGSSKSNVSYSLFAGSAYKLTESLMLDFQYRINHFGELKFDEVVGNNAYEGKIKDMYAVEGALGIRYQF